MLSLNSKNEVTFLLKNVFYFLTSLGAQIIVFKIGLQLSHLT